MRLVTGELERRFENQHVPAVLSLESTLMKTANGEDFEEDFAILSVLLWRINI